MARGSKPGERRGGRKPGVRNKRTAAVLAEIEASGEMPLAYMLRVMRESTEPERKDRMAMAAAPFCHPRLSNIEATVDATMKHEGLLDRVAEMEAAGKL